MWRLFASLFSPDADVEKCPGGGEAASVEGGVESAEGKVASEAGEVTSAEGGVASDEWEVASAQDELASEVGEGASVDSSWTEVASEDDESRVMSAQMYNGVDGGDGWILD